MSGVTVARKMASTSLPSIPLAASAFFAASRRGERLPRLYQRYALADACPLRIHWSEVSTIFSRSALVSNCGGTYVQAEIFARHEISQETSPDRPKDEYRIVSTP